jgi:pimeloyl-ACP methyl ester carboxylesterase
MIDVGRGTPLLIIPGIQGRWEWLGPAVRSLSTGHRVLTFSLDGLSGGTCAAPFEGWLSDIDAVLDRAGVTRAVLVGVSFGGLIAVRYAAERPARVAALVLVSTPAPRPTLDPTSRKYLKHPRLALPAFAWRGLRRVVPEAMSAERRWSLRLRFLAGYAARAMRFPVSPTAMASWVRAWMQCDFEPDCRRIAAPTLVVTGERHLDKVVPVSQTLEYLGLIRAARHVELRGTGHVGIVSRPDDFARTLSSFLGEAIPGVKPGDRSRGSNPGVDRQSALR